KKHLISTRPLPPDQNRRDRQEVWADDLRSQRRPTSPCQLVSRSPQRLGGYRRAGTFVGVEPLSSLTAGSGLQGIWPVRVPAGTSRVQSVCSLPWAQLATCEETWLSRGLQTAVKGVPDQNWPFLRGASRLDKHRRRHSDDMQRLRARDQHEQDL